MDRLLKPFYLRPVPANYPQLEHPPITEAIFTLNLADPVSLSALQRCVEQPTFKGWEPQDEHEFSVHIPGNVAEKEDPTSSIVSTAQKIGFSLKKPDGSRIINVRQDQISYHIIGPYPSGDTMLEEVRQGILAIVAVAENVQILRTGARYVNQIKRPDDSSERIRDVFSVYPQLPEGFNNGLNGFFQQLSFPSADNSLSARVIQTVILPSASETARTFVLDIDVTSPHACGSDLEQVWNCFQNLREFKNQIFKAFLTDRIYQSFNPIQP